MLNIYHFPVIFYQCKTHNTKCLKVIDSVGNSHRIPLNRILVVKVSHLFSWSLAFNTHMIGEEM